MLTPGTLAPDFTLLSTLNGTTSFKDLKGKPIILAFYPADNTPVCTNQLALYNEIKEQGLFDDYDAQILGISVDNIEKHRNFSQKLNLSFSLLADDNPHAEITKKYGVYDEKTKISKRALFVINSEGKIHWSYISPINENPGADGILEALETLN
ncbi:MAG: peroxiredoxin [Candidatus Hodarchaeales archaeon]|jgi:peroxiredoxin